MMDELGLMEHYWYPIFMASFFLYSMLILYLHHIEGYDLE